MHDCACQYLSGKYSKGRMFCHSFWSVRFSDMHNDQPCPQAASSLPCPQDWVLPSTSHSRRWWFKLENITGLWIWICLAISCGSCFYAVWWLSLKVGCFSGTEFWVAFGSIFCGQEGVLLLKHRTVVSHFKMSFDSYGLCCICSVRAGSRKTVIAQQLEAKLLGRQNV